MCQDLHIFLCVLLVLFCQEAMQRSLKTRLNRSYLRNVGFQGAKTKRDGKRHKGGKIEDFVDIIRPCQGHVMAVHGLPTEDRQQNQQSGVNWEKKGCTRPRASKQGRASTKTCSPSKEESRTSTGGMDGRAYYSARACNIV